MMGDQLTATPSIGASPAGYTLVRNTKSGRHTNVRIAASRGCANNGAAESHTPAAQLHAQRGQGRLYLGRLLPVIVDYGDAVFLAENFERRTTP